MNLVVLADDAFSFLLCWEFMSLASWALVMAHHREAGNAAGGLHLPRDGEFRHAGAAAGLRPAGRPGGRLRLRRDPRYAAHAVRGRLGADPGADRRRLEGRPGAAACLAAAGASGGAEPCLGADERRHDQGRGLRLHPHRLRPARPADLVGERDRARRSAASPPCMGVLYATDADRPEAPARLQHGRKHRHHLHRPRPCAGLPGQRHDSGRRRSPSPRRCSTCSTTRCSRACCSSAPARC